MRTPPGISSATYAKALQEFANVVGDEWVFTSDDDLDLYRDAYTPVRDQPEERLASGAIAPKNTSEVQAVVRIANKYRIPIYAISTGRNLGYGGCAPAYSGSVVVDLKRMNRIIEVNDSNHYAIVEPGVSYFDLYNYVQERGLKVWLDVPDPGWGSPIGNALDHGVGYTNARFRNHFDAHCGMEVVLANGEVMRTGMGALPNAKTSAQFKMGFGPIVDGMFSQSNFGIVTQMGFWLMPAPEAFMQTQVFAPRYDDIHPLVELLKYVENSGLAGGMPQLGSPLLGAEGDSQSMVEMFYSGPPKLAAEHVRLIQTARAGFSPDLERYGLKNSIPYWKMQLTFYGPPMVMQAQWAAIQDRAKTLIKDVRFDGGEVLTDPKEAVRNNQIYAQNVGIPNLEFFALGTRAGGNPFPKVGHIGFTPIIPQTGDALIEFNRVYQESVKVSPVLQKVASMHPQSFIFPAGFYERSFFLGVAFLLGEEHEFNQVAIDAIRELIRIGADHGWGEYRTPPIFQDQAMGVYSFNNNALLRFHETIKDAVDPNGILSAGRYGIWPRHLRGKKQ